MGSKQLNRIVLLIACVIGINTFSQMKMVDIDGNKFSVNLKTEKSSMIKILDDINYSVYYILDRKALDFRKKGLGTVTLVNLIFFSKKYNKGIFTVFEQGVVNRKKSIYDITIRISYFKENMFIPSMAILDEDFNYEYFMKYYYMQPPPPKGGDYKSWITIQDTKNYCNLVRIDLKGNAIYENIDDILNNISKIDKDNNTRKDCNSIIYDIDMRDYFPNKIIK